MSGCALAAHAGVIRGVLQSIDCQVQQTAQSGYLALTGPGSVFPTALVTLLTIYIAVLGYSLLFGTGLFRLQQTPGIAIKIGLVLTFTLSWTAFQTIVFDLAMKAPLELAHTIALPAQRSGAALAADPLGGLQVVYDQLGLDATAFGKLAEPNAQALRGGEAAAADGLWKAQAALFTSTAGLLAIAIIATGVLCAVGPVFVALALFETTRGFFVGWVRALVAVSLIPAVNWITTVVLLIVIEPSLVDLAKSREAGAPSLETAASIGGAVVIFALAQAVLAIGMGMLATGFRLRSARPWPSPREREISFTTGHPPMLSRAERLAEQLRRSSPSSGVYDLRPAGFPATAGTRPSSVRGYTSVRASLGATDGYRRSGYFDRLRKAGERP